MVLLSVNDCRLAAGWSEELAAAVLHLARDWVNSHNDGHVGSSVKCCPEY